MEYDLILADPPWKQTKGGLRKSRPKQNKELDYNTISLNEIKKHLSSIKSNTLFLWTIDKYLFQAQEIAESLGYKLHARIIWDKTNGVAPAFTIRYSHEYLLWFYKSPMLKINKDMRGKFKTVFCEKSSKHSKKPNCIYEFIERIYPNSKKVELYARNKRIGWHSWGDEIESDISLSNN